VYRVRRERASGFNDAKIRSWNAHSVSCWKLDVALFFSPLPAIRTSLAPTVIQRVVPIGMVLKMLLQFRDHAPRARWTMIKGCTGNLIWRNARLDFHRCQPLTFVVQRSFIHEKTDYLTKIRPRLRHLPEVPLWNGIVCCPDARGASLQFRFAHRIRVAPTAARSKEPGQRRACAVRTEWGLF
jgi:hypothetical protein